MDQKESSKNVMNVTFMRAINIKSKIIHDAENLLVLLNPDPIFKKIP